MCTHYTTGLSTGNRMKQMFIVIASILLVSINRLIDMVVWWLRFVTYSCSLVGSKKYSLCISYILLRNASNTMHFFLLFLSCICVQSMRSNPIWCIDFLLPRQRNTLRFRFSYVILFFNHFDECSNESLGIWGDWQRRLELQRLFMVFNVQ